MEKSILEVFKQAAVHFQRGLLTLLEFVNFRNRKSMLQEAIRFGCSIGIDCKSTCHHWPCYIFALVDDQPPLDPLLHFIKL